jgi:two-component system, chemotaxis family, CheB/CheR fusion protein
VDQLRTATEEHGASYEELLSLNEELQSSNEELEASKEELQSLNEELTTTNRQLEERNEELRTLTTDLDNLLVSTNVPTVFLDRELRVRRFTPATAAVCRSPAPSDLGRPLAELALPSATTACSPTPSRCSRTPRHGRGGMRQRAGAGSPPSPSLPHRRRQGRRRLPDLPRDHRAEAGGGRQRVRPPLRRGDHPHLAHAPAGARHGPPRGLGEPGLLLAFEIDEAQTVGRRIYELGNGQWAIPRVRALLEEAPTRGEREVRDYEVEHLFERIGWRSMRLNADVMPRNGRPDLILVSIEDVTDLRKARWRPRAAPTTWRRTPSQGRVPRHARPRAAQPAGGPRQRGRAPSRTGDAAIEPTRAMMARQTGRMTAMLDQLLDVARVISGKFELAREVADMAEAARSAVEGVKPLLDAAGHELIVSLPPPNTVLVLGDAARLAQITENLLANAIKYTGDGGRIWVTLEATSDSVKLSVRDTGIGVAPALLRRIFDLFTQAPAGLERAKGGLGLGLALVRSLAQMHGGSAEAFSAGPGRGTEIVVTLPRLHTERHASPGVVADVTTTTGTPRRILVVDDEADAAETLVEILTLQGHTAHAVLDGESALTLALTLDPELVLLDLGLPKMDGYEVARRLREMLGRRVTLVALTGYRADRVRLREAGFDGHLLKPSSLEKLVALVATLDTREGVPERVADAPRPSHKRTTNNEQRTTNNEQRTGDQRKAWSY